MAAGRKKKPFNVEEFEKLCAIQCTEAEICGWFRICSDTLETRLMDIYGKKFSEVFNIYRQDGKISLRRMQFQLAQKHPSMGIWLGKQHLEQKEQIVTSQDNNLAESTYEILNTKEKEESNELLKEFTQ